MIKAPLDEKNICPSVIVDDLTCCDNIFHDNRAVGFINIGSVSDIPCIFTWHDNEMTIAFINASYLLLAIGELIKYAANIMETSEGNIVVIECCEKSTYIMRFYNHETE